MLNDSELLQCYNRGCGKKFDPNDNNSDSCVHHPGLPFFHDAYKGWSCCNKKSTDFTEFLNIQGCSKSKHSNVKPVEPEKPPQDDNPKEVIEIKPLAPFSVKRPPIDTPMVTMKPEITNSLKQQLESNATAETPTQEEDSDQVSVGTLCKRGGCNMPYEGPQTDEVPCVHHPGTPIFHEGMKYWSCCQRKTSDFTTFLNQVGCERGKHLWKKQDADSRTVQCKWDWHQTSSHVVVSIYAKDYHPTLSMVQLNPIRLFASVVFPRKQNATFTLEFDLQGVVDLKACQVSMLASKIEIKLKKAEPGSWSRVDLPKPKSKTQQIEQNLTPQIESVDLSDL